MKKITVFSMTMVCLIALWCGISHAGAVGVVDSKHDLSDLSPDGALKFATDDVCVFCHTPHGASPDYTATLAWVSGTGYVVGSGGSVALWNRNLPDTTSYQLYTSATMEAPLTQVRSYSLMCLSCHDGLTAMNVLRNNPQSYADDTPADGRVDALDGLSVAIGNVINAYSQSINIGDQDYLGGPTTSADLRNDHPISFDYTVHQSTDSGLRAATPDANGWYVNSTKVRLFPNPSNSAVSLECPTCHDAHNYGVVDDYTTNYPFLVMPNAGSALCFNCHLK